jgi:hypothetical protein
MTGSGTLWTVSERAMHEAVNVRPKLHWKPQDVGNTMDVECLPRKL